MMELDFELLELEANCVVGAGTDARSSGEEEMTKPVQRMVVFEEVYKDSNTSERTAIWVALAVERDTSSQGKDPEEAVRALAGALVAEEHVCAERGCALPGPTPQSVLRRVMGLDTGLLPNRQFVRDRIAQLAARPKAYAQTREAFLMQLALLLEFGDVEHPMLVLMPAAVEVAHVQRGNANAGFLRDDLDETFAAALVKATNEALT